MKYDAINKMQLRERRFTVAYIREVSLKGYALSDKKKAELVIKYYDKTEKRPLLKFKNLIRRENVHNMVTELLINLTEKHGISAKEAIEYRKQALKGALEKGDYGNVNKALDSFDLKLDLIPTKQITTHTQEVSYVELLEGSKLPLLGTPIKIKEHKTAKTGDNGK